MSSVLKRNCIFIDSSNPSLHNQVIDGTQPTIRLPFPPYIDPYDLVESRDGKIPSRAPNAFIIYRKIFIQCARDQGYFLPMTVISSMASQSWKKESEDVKEEYRRLSKEAFEVRNEMLPKANRKRRREKWNLVTFGKSDRPRRKSPVFKTQEPTNEGTNSASAEDGQSSISNLVNLQTRFTGNEISSFIPFEQFDFDFGMIPSPEIPEIYNSSPGSSSPNPSEEEFTNEQFFLMNYFNESEESIAVDPLTLSTETINISTYSENNIGTGTWLNLNSFHY